MALAIALIGKQSWIQKIREQLSPFLRFWGRFWVFWAYFCRFLGLFSAILRYIMLFYAILHYFTLIFDSMISYLSF